MTENNIFYIYYHINNLTNKVFYVGMSKNKGDNFKRAYSKKNRNKYWYNTTKKYNYHVDIIHKNLTQQEAIKLEIFYILRFGRKDLKTGILVNLTDGGEGNFNPSQETRNKIAEGQRKRKGYKMSTDAIKNMVISRTGSKRSKKAKENMSNARKGMKFTEEHKQNLSKSHKNKIGNTDLIHTVDTKYKIRSKLSNISIENIKLIELDINKKIKMTEISKKYNVKYYQVVNIKEYMKREIKINR